MSHEGPGSALWLLCSPLRCGSVPSLPATPCGEDAPGGFGERLLLRRCCKRVAVVWGPPCGRLSSWCLPDSTVSKPRPVPGPRPRWPVPSSVPCFIPETLLSSPHLLGLPWPHSTWLGLSVPASPPMGVTPSLPPAPQGPRLRVSRQKSWCRALGPGAAAGGVAALPGVVSLPRGQGSGRSPGVGRGGQGKGAQPRA